MTTPAPAQIAPDGTWPMNSANGPCRTWPLSPDCGCLPPDPATWDAQQIHAVETATEILWRLTAGRFGLCRELIRPCTESCRPDPCALPTPALIDGRWFNLACGCPRARDDCSCGTPPDRLSLPGPVYWVDPRHPLPDGGYRYGVEVWADGQLLPDDATHFWMYEPNRLTRIDGGTWPVCQDLAAPPDGPGAFSVLYWRGAPVPPGGRRAAAVLACEIWKACAKGPDSCALPRRVQTVQREGLTYTMIDSLDFLQEGRTGLGEVDLWLSAVNPGNLRSPSTVASPDMPRHQGEWTGGTHPAWYAPTAPASRRSP